MAIDSSIALQAKLPTFDNPLTQYAQVAAIQNAQSTNRLADLTYSEKQREVEQTNALNAAYKAALSPDGTVDRNKLYTGLASSGLGSKLPAVQKGYADQDKATADLAQSKSKTAETDGKLAVQRQEAVGNTLGAIAQIPNPTPQHVVNGIQHLVDIGTLAPDLGQKIIGGIPKDPSDLQAWLIQGRNAVMKAADQMKYTTATADAKLTSDTSIKTTGMNNRTAIQVGESNNRTAVQVGSGHDAATRDGQNKPVWDSERGAFVDPRTGQATMAVGADGKPLGNKDKAPPAEYAKQSEAYLNMGDALTSYKTKLTNFGAMSYLSPSDRSDLGTSYQNVLLQAKELYRLGVLNGPDEGILKTIITNPLEWKNGALPKEAMLKQAEQLEGIVTNSSKNLAKVYGRAPIPLNSAIKAAQSGSEGMTNKSKSGKPIVFRNGQWEYQ